MQQKQLSNQEITLIKNYNEALEFLFNVWIGCSNYEGKFIDTDLQKAFYELGECSNRVDEIIMSKIKSIKPTHI